jgi:2-isopropylmalate synthase
MKFKLQKTREEVLDLIKFSVEYAKQFTQDVEWSPEDATRTDSDYLCKTVEHAIECGATTINIPDTVGYATPSDYERIIKDLFNRVPNIDKVVVSTHTHNDLGLGVANALAGISAGARQVECTINGIGERAGNAALEEIVMAIKTRNDLMPYETNINTKKISACSKLVSSVTGFPIQYNKAIVGKNAFAHESGIHQDGMLKNKQTYEIMTPESVGVVKSSLVMGKHSGRHAFKEKLEALGYPNFDEKKIDDSFKKFKDLADKKKHVFDEDIVALIDDDLMKDKNVIQLVSLNVIAGTKGQKAEIELDIFGKISKTEQSGDGPVDSIFKGIKELFPHNVNLQLYQVHAVTEGTDAQATVSVRIEEDGKISVGQAADTDTLVASAKAYINALNKLIIKRKRTAPRDEFSAAV